MVLDTMGVKLHVKFDHSGSATMLGQLSFFIEFLQTGGLYERWIKSAPLSYSSPNAPRVEDVLGTLFFWPHCPGCAATATSTAYALTV